MISQETYVELFQDLGIWIEENGFENVSTQDLLEGRLALHASEIERLVDKYLPDTDEVLDFVSKLEEASGAVDKTTWAEGNQACLDYLVKPAARRYELYTYLDDPETLDKIGLVVMTERHYADGAVTRITATEDDTFWFMEGAAGITMAYGQIYTSDRQYGPA